MIARRLESETDDYRNSSSRIESNDKNKKKNYRKEKLIKEIQKQVDE